jgi:exopolysaccharide biosynthesis polyprenyl glycosylphosphotransferase
VIPSSPYIEDLNGLTVVNIRHVPLSNTVNMFIKRTMDLICALIILIIFSPVMIISAIAIRVSDGGSAIFKQERVGRHNRPFMMYKFRTMKEQSEKDELKGWTTKGDPRVTAIGRFLRRTSLDELPQLINILLGQMSLVGPRPVTEPELVKYGEYKDYVLSVSPGLTGMWQVSGRSDTGYEERISFDTYYIQNWSIWLDIWILIKTVWVVLKGKGAY